MDEVKETLGDRVIPVGTDHSEDVKLVRTGASADLPMYWVGSCSQSNLISGIGEHNAMFVGYAKNADKQDQNTQKYNCHKIAEFQVGLQVRQIEGLGNDILALTDMSDPLVQDTFYKVQFYSDILQEERNSKMDMEYWIDYLHEFGVSHKIPLYDHMSFFKYNNLDVWCLVFLIIYIPYLICSYVCCCCCRKKDAKVKAD